MTVLDLKSIKLTIITGKDAKGYDVEEIKKRIPSDLYEAFSRWFSGRAGFTSKDGRNCVSVSDWDQYCDIRMKISQTLI